MGSSFSFGNLALADTPSGKAFSWGDNSSGQLGNGGTTDVAYAKAVLDNGVLSGKSVVQLCAGQTMSVALCSDGTLAAWGSNSSGSLGDGSTANSSVPVAVVMSGAFSGKTVTKIATGGFHTLALCSDGTVVSWGYNVVGQLGNGTIERTNVPVAVTTNGALSGKTVTDIAAGYTSSYALCSDGTLVSWGENSDGQLGNGTKTRSSVPVEISNSGALSGKSVTKIVAGGFHTLALCSDGALVSWGKNEYGQLGDGTQTTSAVPVEVPKYGALTGKTVTQLAGGSAFSLALCSDGTVVGWGLNGSGELGRPYYPLYFSVVPLVIETRTQRPVIQIMAGGAFGLALDKERNLVSWGANSDGQLGIGVATTYMSGAVSVGRGNAFSSNVVSQLATGCASNHSLVIANANRAPFVAVNKALQVRQYGLSAPITNAHLKVSDPDDNGITYTVTTLPTQGTVRLYDFPLAVGRTFTQNDIDEGRVSYRPNQNAPRGNDSFRFSVSDGYGGSIPEADGVFTITIIEPKSLQVTTAEDVVAEDGYTSLREALAVARETPTTQLMGVPLVSFAGEAFASAQTLTLSQGPLPIDYDVRIVGPTAGLAISGGDAGRIFNVQSGKVFVANLTLRDGKSLGATSSNWGGAVINKGTLEMVSCTFTDNASTAGGALYNAAEGTAKLSNSTFAGNSASPYGGAVFNEGNLSVDSCTVVGNSATGAGGGLVTNGGTANVVNTLVAGNSAGQHPDVHGLFVSQGFNFVGKSDGATGFAQGSDKTGTIASPLDPKVGPLQNNGGSTPTTALLAGSPAIDAGQTEQRMDQRLVTRPQRRGDDIGAFEYQNSTPVLTDVSIEQSAPKTKDTLTVAVGTQSDGDGDSLTRSYVWKKNGAPIGGQTGATLDLGVAGHGDKGDKISVVVTVNDGTNSVSSESPEITIVNSAPSVLQADIYKGEDLKYEPKTLDRLHGLFKAEDADGDKVTLSFGWKKNGQLLNVPDEPGLWLSAEGNGDRGDKISFVVTASDGEDQSSAESDALTIVNSEPSQFAVRFDQVWIYTNTLLRPTVTPLYGMKADDDNDALTITRVWKKNGVVIEGETGETLDLGKAGYGDQGDTITLIETRDDGHGGVVTAQGSTAIRNSPSVPTSVKLVPASPKSNDVLRAVVEGTDIDGEPEYSYYWAKNGIRLNTYEATLDLSQTLAGESNGDKGDVITVTVFGRYSSDPTLSASTIIVNGAPNFVPAAFKTVENTSISGQIGAQDPDGDAFTLSVARTTGRGKLEFGSDGSFTYTPLANFNGTDSFIVRATDAEGAVSTATYSIAVEATNGAPVPANDVVSGYEDVPITIPAAALLRNDSNGELRGEVDELKIVRVAAPAGFPGTLRLDVAKQTITFTPRLNWSGNTLFVYTVQDSKRATGSGQVDLKIAPINDAPVAFAGRMTVVGGALGELKLTGSDVENDVLSFALSTRPANGTASVVKVGADWVLRYQSKAGFSGVDTLTVVARDGKLNSAPATITITVKPNTAPQLVTLVPNRGTVPSGTSVVFEQKVRDADGTANLDAVALVPSASATTLVTRGGAAIWFDAINNQFTMTKDDGKTTFAPVGLGRTLENAQMRVTLGTGDVIRGANGLMAVRWRITFKPTYVGVKSLWGRVEDQAGLSAGFTNMGQITVGSSASGAFNPSAPGS